jgi:hypothetical protein
VLWRESILCIEEEPWVQFSHYIQIAMKQINLIVVVVIVRRMGRRCGVDTALGDVGTLEVTTS